jgi:hypothetical protein
MEKKSLQNLSPFLSSQLDSFLERRLLCLSIGEGYDAGELFVADGQLFAAFLAAGSQDFASTLGFHAGEKSVNFQMFAFLELGNRHGVGK